MAITELIDGMIDLIRLNIIAKTNVTSDVLTTNIVKVQNSFYFEPGQEVVLIDFGYNNENYSPTSHYEVYEYARVKEIPDTRTLVLYDNTVSDWYVSDRTFIQKTIGHSPMYDDRVYYGDREVIPTEDMAITVEPVSKSNEWIYLHGGLSEEYRVSIIIYGKDIETEEGMKILNKYTDAVYDLFNGQLHLDVNNYDTPLLANVAAGTTTVVIQDTEDNREQFQRSMVIPDDEVYEIQDNLNVEIDLYITDVTIPGDGKIYIEVSQNDPALYGAQPIMNSYNINEYAVFRKHGRYFYDSRVDNVEFGTIQKGSAFLRAARLNWFGKEVQEYQFPQKSKGVRAFDNIESPLGESSSSSSGP
jgi:hypothetical protein